MKSGKYEVRSGVSAPATTRPGTSKSGRTLALDAPGADLMVRMLQRRIRRNQRSLADAARKIAAAATQLADAIERTGSWGCALTDWQLAERWLPEIERSATEIACAGDLLLLVQGALSTPAPRPAAASLETAPSPDPRGPSGITVPWVHPPQRPSVSRIVVTWSPTAQAEARAIRSNAGRVPHLKKGTEP
ncbi:hypothetical protein LZC95_19785 [Pendulispora brunnea]|uniref:Uncharacterized protein n=1 Tax=Pendulispora brunnea TaxID=2905690 RepID=A0ABZ2KPR4_9BACT